MKTPLAVAAATTAQACRTTHGKLRVCHAKDRPIVPAIRRIDGTATPVVILHDPPHKAPLAALVIAQKFCL